MPIRLKRSGFSSSTATSISLTEMTVPRAKDPKIPIFLMPYFFLFSYLSRAIGDRRVFIKRVVEKRGPFGPPGINR